MSSRYTFHLAGKLSFERQRGNDSYIPDGFESEGFIHCTDGSVELANSGNRHLRNDPAGYLILVIDLDKIEAEVRIAPEPGIYPHIHGPLNNSAVVAVRPAPRALDGEFLAADLHEFE